MERICQTATFKMQSSVDDYVIAFRYVKLWLKYSKTCLKWPLKIDKTKVLKTNDRLMKVKSIAECSKRAFCNTFDLQAINGLENQFLVFFLIGRLRQI